MRHTGTLYLSKTAPQANMARCGAFQLQMLLYDRLGTHHIEPWRVTWTGRSAQRFWLEHAATLKPGAAVVVELERTVDLVFAPGVPGAAPTEPVRARATAELRLSDP